MQVVSILFACLFFLFIHGDVSAQTTCIGKPHGDATCNDVIDSADYIVWKCEYLNGGYCAATNTTASSDFNADGKVSLIDLEIWVRGLLYIFPTPTGGPTAPPGSSPTPVGPSNTPPPGASPTTAATVVPTQPPSGSGYSASGGKIFRNGTEIRLKGLNWFGFETNDHVVHGLWARNWKDQITQMKVLGFNAVRLPFCPAVIQGAGTNTIDFSKNADLQGLNSLQVFDKVVNELNNQQMYVLLDHHRPDCNAISELWYTSSYSEAQWIADLKFMADRYKALPYVMGMDLKNEPHDDNGNGVRWGSGNAQKDWNTAAEKAGAAVLASNPNLVIFVEGIGNNQSTCSDSSGFFWGQNLMPIACTPINTASIPANKLVLSPHVYGPDVFGQSYFNDSSFPANMPAIWDKQFGFTVASGYTLVPGEWGGKYGTGGGNPKDKVWQDAFVSYMKSKHICNSFYWDWNPNSGDTGGILKDDWQTPWTEKVNMLTSYYSTCN